MDHTEDDMYVAECPKVGTVCAGSTVEEAVSNLNEATDLYLEEFPLTRKRRAILATFGVSSVASSYIRFLVTWPLKFYAIYSVFRYPGEREAKCVFRK